MKCSEFRASYRLGSPARFDESDVTAAVDHMNECSDCRDWYMASEVAAAGGDLSSHPCVHVAYRSLHRCTQHVDPHVCPETTLVKRGSLGPYAIPVRDGGRSSIA